MPESAPDRVHDVVVLGGGPGGYATALRAAARGLDVALIEADKVGGTCLHRGCIPSKATLHVAEVLEEVNRAEVLGLKLAFEGVDPDGLQAFRQGVVDNLHKGLKHLVASRTDFVQGWGRLVEPNAVEVVSAGGERNVLRGRHVVVATGSIPRLLPGVEVGGPVMTSDEAVGFGTPPRRAVIVGAGAIGMEFASMWHPMGTEVTVVEALDRVLPLEDADVSKAVAKSFSRSGIEVLTSCTLSAVEVDGDVAAVTLDTAGGVSRIEADAVLVAIGRAPRTPDTGADELGVLDGRGFVVTDEWGQTDQPGLWAVGDVRPTLALAHAAFAEGFVVADRIAGIAEVQPVDHRLTPRVTYCRPEVASVGLTEQEAEDEASALGVGITTTTYSLRANAKGIIAGSDGFVKVVARADGAGTSPGATGEILGVHVVGPHATELISEATLATSWGALPEELAAITHAHPTLYEAMGEAFQAIAGLPFHGH